MFQCSPSEFRGDLFGSRSLTVVIWIIDAVVSGLLFQWLMACVPKSFSPSVIPPSPPPFSPPLSNTSITNFLSGKRISISCFPSPYPPLSPPLSPPLCLFPSTTCLSAPLWHFYNYVVSWNNFSLFFYWVPYFSPPLGPSLVLFAFFFPPLVPPS